MNSLALGMMACGFLLVGLGLFLAIKHRKTIGITVAIIGLGTAAAPFIVTLFLFR